jgi:hypothetical protein
MKRAILLMFLAVLPAMAAEEGPHHSATKEGDAKKGGAPGTNVDMPFLMAPISGEDGKLTGYAYISSRLTAASNGAALTAREKVPFIQDVFVRDVNSRQITSAAHPDSVDIPALEARLLADARKVMGAGQVKTITVCTVQMAALKAKAPPARSPGQDGEAAPAEKSRCSN